MIAVIVAVALQQAFVFGGTISCAAWLESPSTEVQGSQWLLGFWSGKNMEAEGGGQVGRSTDAAGVVGEVRLVCQASPSKSLISATLETYNRFKAEGR